MTNQRQRWQRLSLRWRLLLLNLVSVGLSLGIFTYISHVYKQDAFPQRLHYASHTHLIDKDIDSDDVPTVLMLFHQVNNEGTLLGVLITSACVTGLTYWFSCSLYRPLNSIEEAIDRFNDGDFSARAPLSTIPEINHLCLTLNSAAARLQDVEERRRLLVGDLTHELGTPLTVIKGYLELAETDKVELTNPLVGQLLEEANRMSRLLSDLQLLSKVEAGNFPLRLEVFNPVPIIERLITTFSIQCQQAGKSMTWFGVRTLPSLYADPDRLIQILVNLLSNAIRYTVAGDCITISSHVAKRYLWISVSNTGMGMAPEEVPFVFDRFWRSQTAKAIRNDGSGLGLAITKRLVEVQGGEIKAECDLGRGCTFRFALPLA